MIEQYLAISIFCLLLSYIAYDNTESSNITIAFLMVICSFIPMINILYALLLIYILLIYAKK